LAQWNEKIAGTHNPLPGTRLNKEAFAMPMNMKLPLTCYYKTSYEYFRATMGFFFNDFRCRVDNICSRIGLINTSRKSFYFNELRIYVCTYKYGYKKFTTREPFGCVSKTGFRGTIGFGTDFALEKVASDEQYGAPCLEHMTGPEQIRGQTLGSAARRGT
jgi:hypothetical protein